VFVLIATDQVDEALQLTACLCQALRFPVEGRLEVLEREGEVEDADVALAEFLRAGLAPAPLIIVVVSLSLPEEARNAASAVEPPVTASSLRRETGSLATRASALSLLATAIGSSSFAGGGLPRLRDRCRVGSVNWAPGR
jgi:hypothetical protein